MLDFSVLTSELAIQFLILMLIGMGPKIALVPFLEATQQMSREDQRAVADKMVKVAVITALLIFAAGALLMRLLHISDAAVSVAGGIVFLLLALRLIDSPDKKTPRANGSENIEKLAVYPLAVPYLFNPVGMTLLMIASNEVSSLPVIGFVLGCILFIGLLDWLIFRNAHIIASRMSPSGRTVSEIVFGILLAAVAIQLIYFGLVRFGIVDGEAL